MCTLTAKLHSSRTVATLVVNQHQRVVGRQSTQRGGSYQTVGIINFLGINVIRRNQVSQQVIQVRRTLILEIVETS